MVPRQQCVHGLIRVQHTGPALLLALRRLPVVPVSVEQHVFVLPLQQSMVRLRAKGFGISLNIPRILISSIDATGICLAFADANCCDAVSGMTCATCVATNSKCAYCADQKVCSNACSSAVSLNVTQSWGWMCNDPLLLNCEAQAQCGNCVAGENRSDTR